MLVKGSYLGVYVYLKLVTFKPTYRHDVIRCRKCEIRQLVRLELMSWFMTGTQGGTRMPTTCNIRLRVFKGEKYQRYSCQNELITFSTFKLLFYSNDPFSSMFFSTSLLVFIFEETLRALCIHLVL